MYKYKNLNNEFKILNEFDILWLTLIVVKEKTKYHIYEKTSWIIIQGDIQKEKIKDLEMLKLKLFYKIDSLIFFNWINYTNDLIIKQREKSGELIKI